MNHHAAGGWRFGFVPEVPSSFSLVEVAEGLADALVLDQIVVSHDLLPPGVLEQEVVEDRLNVQELVHVVRFHGVLW